MTRVKRQGQLSLSPGLHHRKKVQVQNKIKHTTIHKCKNTKLLVLIEYR